MKQAPIVTLWKKNKLAAVIIIAVLLLAVTPVALLIGMTVWGFSSEPNTDKLALSIVDQSEVITDASAYYGHSGAPWNNNLSVNAELTDVSVETAKTATKEIATVLLEETKGTPNYNVSITFYNAVETADEDNKQESMSVAEYQAICDDLFASARCTYAITVYKADLEAL